MNDMFNLNIFKDQNVITENKIDDIDDLFYLEGWKDTLKRGYDVVKKTIKKVLVLPRVSKSPFGCSILHYLIMRTKPTNIAGIPLLGTSLRVVKTESGYKVENANFVSTKRFDEKFFKEATDSSIERIQKKIEDFAKKNNVETIIAKPGSGLENILVQAQTPAAAIPLNESNMRQLKDTGDIIKPVMGGSFDRSIIVFSGRVIPLHLLSDKILDHLLQHEFGHVKTFHLVTDEDYAEYFAKAGVIRNMATLQSAGIPIDEIKELVIIGNAIYANLKPEKLANDYFKLDFRVVIKGLFGIEVPDNWRSHKFAKLLDIKFPPNMIRIFDKIMKSLTNEVDPSDMKSIVDFSVDLYPKILDEKYANPIIQILKSAI